MSGRVEMIRQKLTEALSPEHLDVEDQSALHAGHAGAREGKGHYAVVIVSDRFAGQSPVGRHRMVYRALGEAMQTDIHALAIKALTPDEYQSR